MVVLLHRVRGDHERAMSRRALLLLLLHTFDARQVVVAPRAKLVVARPFDGEHEQNDDLDARYVNGHAGALPAARHEPARGATHCSSSHSWRAPVLRGRSKLPLQFDPVVHVR